MCEASVKDGPLTAAADPQNEDTLESVCVCLLKCCDTAYIPTVTVSHTHNLFSTFTTCTEFIKHVNTHLGCT